MTSLLRAGTARICGIFCFLQLYSLHLKEDRICQVHILLLMTPLFLNFTSLDCRRRSLLHELGRCSLISMQAPSCFTGNPQSHLKDGHDPHHGDSYGTSSYRFQLSEQIKKMIEKECCQKERSTIILLQKTCASG